MKDGIVKSIVNFFVPYPCHPNSIVANSCMVSSISIVSIGCMMMVILRMLLIEMIRKMIFTGGCYMRSRIILLRGVS